MIPLPTLMFELLKAEAARDRDEWQRGRWMIALRDCCRGLLFRLGLRGQPRPLCCAVGAA